MKKSITRVLFAIASALLLTLSGCGDDIFVPDDEPGPPDPPDPPGPTYTGKVTLVSTTLGETIPWRGGEAEFVVEADTEDGKWAVRIVHGTEEDEPAYFDETTAVLRFPMSVSDTDTPVTVQLYSEEEWTEAASAGQEPGAIRVGETLWSKGNLTVEEERFTFAGETETGMFFRHNSHYAVPSEGIPYGGVVYTPEEQTLPWSAIAELTGKDPCRMVAPENTWRTPDTGQLDELFDMIEDFGQKDGVSGQFFAEGRIFLAATGVRDVNTGELGYVGTNGGYWGRGADEDGFGEMVIFSPEYAMVYYNLMNNLSTLRCVRMDDYADYESHAPETGPAAGYRLTVNTTGDRSSYKVAIGYGLEFYVEKDASGRSVEFDIPTYDGFEPRGIDIWVDGTYTGKKAVQSGIKQYALYDSHTPEGPVSGDAFTLTVKCMSDMDTFDVNVYTGDKSVNVTVQGSKNNLAVAVPIPANRTGSPRELKIKVKGVEAPATVVQEHRPETYGETVWNNVTWAKGNIVLRGGQFQIGEANEYGLFFRKNSIYGMPSDAPTYGGAVYSPASGSYTWGDIPYNDGGDPCLLVAPAGTWRTPTYAEIENLHASAGSLYTLSGVNGRHYADNNMFIPAAGIMSGPDGTRTSQGSYGYIRCETSSVMSFLGEEAKLWTGMDDYGYSVRCVKRQNFADYVSHTPTGEQPAAAFTLTVNCVSDLASFPVQVKGGDVDITLNGSSGSPSVVFSIPANDSPLDRDLVIYVNGLGTGRSVRQKAGGGLEWSTGYLTVKDGAYVFADPQQVGMFFKYNSRYAVPFETNYQGVVYGPSATNYASYPDIPMDEVDPCSLVAPAGTWRMPTQQDYKNLMADATSFLATSTYLKYTLNGNDIYFAGPTGSLVASTGKKSLDSYIFIRSSTLDTGSGNYFYFRSKMDTSSATADQKSTGAAATMIRCVK